MPLPVITDTIRVSIRGTTAVGTTFINVLHFRKTIAITFAATIAILDPILLRLYAGTSFGGGGTPWNNNTATTWTITDFTYTPLDGSSASTVITHLVPGTSAAEALPAGVALAFTLRTSLRGRRFRGRSFWGGFSETVSTAGSQPSPAVVTAHVTQWNGLITALVGSGVTMVVASYVASSAENVTTVTCDGRWDSQRRRNN